MQRRATRVDRALLRDVADSIGDRAQRDEMAAPSYLHPIPPVRWLFWKRLDVVTQFVTANATMHRSGLDFGCGLGVMLATLSAATRQVYATDVVMAPAQRMAAALRLDNVRFVELSALAADIPRESLDFVVSTDVLEHVDDLPGVIDRFHALLRPGGRLVVSGPTENALYKVGRVLAGFGGKGDYHHTDIRRIHGEISRPARGFDVAGSRVLPLESIVEAFFIYSYRRR